MKKIIIATFMAIVVFSGCGSNPDDQADSPDTYNTDESEMEMEVDSEPQYTQETYYHLTFDVADSTRYEVKDNGMAYAYFNRNTFAMLNQRPYSGRDSEISQQNAISSVSAVIDSFRTHFSQVIYNPTDPLEEISIDGVKALKLEIHLYEGNGDTYDGDFKYCFIIFTSNQSIYTISFLAPYDLYEEHYPDFEKMLDSMKIDEPEPENEENSDKELSAGSDTDETLLAQQDATSATESNTETVAAQLEETSQSTAGNGKITLATYNSITEGMTYDEVCAIIGGPGELLSEAGAELGAEYFAQMYSWEGVGDLGANANILFQGGRVSTKAQIGLR